MSKSGNIAIILYRLADGRTVAFTHPDAAAERLAAIRPWKMSPKFMATVDKAYDDAFTKEKP